MDNLIYIWIASGIFFILIEIFTTTLYWLSLSVACFVVATYLYVFNIDYVNITQFVIFAFVSLILCIFLPKMFNSNKEDLKMWIDQYVWQEFSLKKVWKDWKIEIDWVDYIVNKDCITKDFSEWVKVILDSHKAWALNVSIK
ncbi:MAG: hypothetical protein ACD_4C00086G0001 [uncultured bacterium (gcode 4)]|uniref:NfeD-like C-terminal domain-containing protein n=1 Tax=uncultured bacterium (gcode 4) TaxID=1234023 RepID=K2GUK6_9BACT|nr:MAG: hypothetical protein ACD_4C00086G0001 [uncultured bacterium (gcode 4)]